MEKAFLPFDFQASLSLPGSPFPIRRGSKASQFSWPKPRHGPRSGDRQPLVLPYLEALNLPYADDSNAVTPTSDELCNSQNTHSFLVGRRRLSSASYNSRKSQRSFVEGSGKWVPGSRKDSFASHHSRHSYTSHGDHGYKHNELTHFPWNKPLKNRGHPLLPEVIVDKTKSDDNVSGGYLFSLSYYRPLAFRPPFLHVGLCR